MKKWSYGITAAAAVLLAGALPGGLAKAASTAVQSNAAVFDARADSAASSYRAVHAGTPLDY